MVARTKGDPMASPASKVKNRYGLSIKINRYLSEDDEGSAGHFRWLFTVFRSPCWASFAGVAWCWPAIGTYGVMAFAVTQRTQEIGIRMALGARASDFLKLVVRNGMSLAVIGLVAGLAGALAIVRLMASLLFGVSPTDVLTFVLVTVGLLLVALLACYIPARRATKVDPLVALRYE